MANRYLIASGDSENPAIYDGGTLPAADDVLRLNGFVWTVTANRTLAQLRCDASAPAVASNASRQVIINNGVTLICTELVQGIADAVDGLIGVQAGGTGTVVSPSFVRGISGVQATSTLNIIGNCDTTGVISSQGLVRGAGTTNITGNVVNPVNYVADAILGGALNITGNITQNGGLGVWARGTTAIQVTGNIINAAVPFYDTTTTTYPTFVHYGSAIAGTAPVIRSRSPYHGTGPFINNGEVMALSCDRVRLLGTDNQWSMIKADGSAQILRTAGLLTGYPPEAKVEDGTVYGPSSEFTGTLSPVNVDVQQLASDLLNEIAISSIPLAERLRNVATTSTVNSAIGSINVIP